MPTIRVWKFATQRRIYYQITRRLATSSTSELPRPPPKVQPPSEMFASPSKPRPYYERPRSSRRDLPSIPNRWAAMMAFGIAGVAAWGTFLLYVTNQERLASSIVRQILINLRENKKVRDVLGEGIRPEPAWYLNGDPWISGATNLLQGNVDISFRIKGSEGAGTLYFTSIRKKKGMPFTILRFKVISDDGCVVHLQTTDVNEKAIGPL